MVYLSAISPAKADRLYWLGRYSERVCTVLHILRKYYDSIIAHEDSQAHVEFCTKMGIPCEFSDSREFVHHYLYDAALPYSVTNMLTRVMDNAILLREEVKSESLQYVEMAINYMRRASEEDVKLYELQYVSDVMYSFWGAIEDRIHTVRVRDLITSGKYIEKLDLYIRFGYESVRIEDVLKRLERIETFSSGLFNTTDFENLKQRLFMPGFSKGDALGVVNDLFAA